MIVLEWLGHRCLIDPGTETIARELLALFPTLARETAGTGEPDREPADARDGEPDLSVRPAGSAFVVRGEDAIRLEREVEAISAVEHAAVLRLLEQDTVHTHLHAAAAAGPDGRAVVVVGPSGAGKSTLAYHWSRSGRPVFGDDIVAVDPEGRLTAFPRPLKVEAGRLVERGDDPECTPARDRQAPDVWVVPAEGGWGAAGTPVARVAHVAYEAGAALEARELSGTGALRMLLSSVHRSGARPAGSLDRFIAMLDGAECLRLIYGDAEEAAAHLIGRADGQAR